MTAPIELRLRAAADALTGERVPLSHLAAVHGPAAQGTLLVLDPPNVITKKIKSAVTDSGRDVRYDPVDQAGISNLIEIYAEY